MEPQLRLRSIPILTLPLGLAAALFFACASAPTVKSMIPRTGTERFASSGKTIRVGAVTGGGKTSPMGASTIEGEGFKEALVEALKSSGIFREVSMDRDCDYMIDAEIISQELKPGLAMTSLLYVAYRLKESGSNKQIWKENVLSQYDAAFNEAAYGVTRAKLANEGAVRENLSQLLKKLSSILARNGP